MFAALLSRLGDALDRAGIPYIVIGGQAVVVRGQPRLTQDVDLTLAAGPDAVPAILGLLSGLDLRPLPRDPLAFAAETMVVPAVDDRTGIRVDLILSWTPLAAEAVGRAEPVTVEGHTYRVASAEDLVVLKVLAGRPRDLDDVRGILVRNPAADTGRIERWLTAFRDVRELNADPVGTFRAIRASLVRA